MKLRTSIFAFAALLVSASASAQVRTRDHRPPAPPPPPPTTQPTPPPPPTPTPTPPPPPPKPAWDSKGWTELGEQIVHGKRDRDTITLGKRAGAYTKLTIVVEDSALDMFDVVVHFGNGETFSPNTRMVFKENSRTGVIDLPGEARVINKVEFRYGNLPGGGKARVELWGKQAPFRWESKGWKLLGEESVDGRRDRDTMTVGAYEGRFDQLTFVVANSDVDIKKIVVWFEDGEKFDTKVKHFFREGSRTHVIDLPGNNRRIAKIDLRYKNVRGDGRKATVQAWGRDTRPWDSSGWTNLGQQTVKGRDDRDSIRVGVREGFFSKLTLVVTDSDLELYDMTVHFTDGTTYQPKLKLVFKEGSRTGVIDLPGEQRTISKVEFRYGNLFGDGKRAKIELWGLLVPGDITERDHRNDRPRKPIRKPKHR